MFRKNPFRTNYPSFFFESSESDRFFNYSHDSHSIFRLERINSENVPGCTVLELYNMEIHQMKLGLDYHRLKTMVKRSIDQNLRMKSFWGQTWKFWTSAVVKNQGTKPREQKRTLGDWQWEFNGQCSRGDTCSFRHDVKKRAKMTQPNPSPNSLMQQNERKA